MAPEELLESELSVLHIHFDVKGHFIETKTLISGMKAVGDIATAINDIHFDGKLIANVYALRSKEGGYLASVGLYVGIIAGLVAIHDSKTFADLVEGYTGKPYDSSKSVKNFGKVLRDATGGFLLTENENLMDITKDNPRYDKSFKSKSDFMHSCSKNKAISGIGFSSEHNFPIKKKDLIKHISNPKVRIEPPQVHLVSGQIVSPVLLKHENRQWTIMITHEGNNKLSKPKKISAHLDDEEFARDFFAGKHPVKDTDGPDLIEAEISTSQVTKDGKIKSRPVRQITKVISFKGERLVDKEYEVETTSKIPPNQGDIFSRSEDESEDK